MGRTLEYRLQVMENEMTQLKEDMRNIEVGPHHHPDDASDLSYATLKDMYFRLQAENTGLKQDLEGDLYRHAPLRKKATS